VLACGNDVYGVMGMRVLITHLKDELLRRSMYVAAGAYPRTPVRRFSSLEVITQKSTV
jgi:hypothetical protein